LADVKSPALRAANPTLPGTFKLAEGSHSLAAVKRRRAQWPAIDSRRSVDPHGLGADHEVAIRDRVIFSLDEFDGQIPTQQARFSPRLIN
jgi:hypothetical protein